MSPSGTRFVGLYAAGLMMGLFWLAYLVFVRDREYDAYVPLWLSAFALPWSLAIFLRDSVPVWIISTGGGLLLNSTLLYRLGRAKDRRQQSAVDDRDQAI